MKNTTHSFEITLDWDLMNLVSKIDRFDASWSSVEKIEGRSLKQLKTIATIRSVGASTRIEGSKMSDKEVEALLENINISKFEDRDSREVAGYFEAMDIISESYKDIQITENSIKSLHNTLLKHSAKDEWHRGDYKLHNNAVEATLPEDSSKQVIFKTTEAGLATEDAMRNLIKWHGEDNKTHPLVKCAVFSYDFVSIHPFQDGNGRLSRLLSTLLLMKHGYTWIQYVSFEHEIESRKTEYYRELRKAQAQRPGEDVSSWVGFFFDGLSNIQDQLTRKLEVRGRAAEMPPREKAILVFIGERPGCRSGQIAKKLNIPNPSVKKMLAGMVAKNLIKKHGAGPGTNYTIN